MAFPAVVTTNESATTTQGTTHTQNLPASLVSGNLIVILFAKGAVAATSTMPAGYNEILDENLARGLSIYWRTSDGAEGATVNVTTSASTKSASVAYQISGAEDPATQPPQLSTVATGTSVNPNATTCTPTGGAKDYLWITFFSLAGEEADDDTWVTATPTSYTGTLQKTAGVAGTNIGVEIASAQQDLNAASQDAAAWTVAASFAWRAYTMAVHPGAAAALPDLPYLTTARR